MHGSYLQGMETEIVRETAHDVVSTDPTYKEWKQKLEAGGKEKERSTDPTYKEWKPYKNTC